MRMIDADALKEQFRQTYRFCWSGKDHKRLTEEKQLIDNAPTIDSFYGYSVEDLVRFASLCQSCNLTPDIMEKSLRDAGWVIARAFEAVFAEPSGELADIVLKEKEQ